MIDNLNVPDTYWWDAVGTSPGTYHRTYERIGEVSSALPAPFTSDIPIMMHSINPVGQLLTVTQAWLDRLGFTRSEVIGRPSTDFLSLDSRRYAGDVLARFWETGTVANVPYKFVHKDGTLLPTRLSANLERLPCGRPRRSLAVLREPDREAHIAQYQVGPVLGVGGMSRVFAGRDPLGEAVVLKVVPTEGFATRARREADALERVQHPAIPKLIEVVDLKEQLVLVLQRIDGVSAFARRGELSVARVQRLGRDVASALIAVHDASLLHRDVKPANIMIERAGEPELTYLIDFGLALVQEETRLTRPGRFVGSPAYASPEQYASNEASAASDVYALGASMYELLAGDVPFPQKNELAFALNPKLPPTLPNIGPALNGLLASMLAPIAEERATMRDVRAALAALTKS